MNPQPQKLTKHHILPKSQGGSNEPHNIKMLKWRTHQAVHTLFDNGTPRDQIIDLVCGLNSSALTREFKNDILAVLQETDHKYYYESGVFLPIKKTLEKVPLYL